MNRRDFLTHSGQGFGTVALAALLADQAKAAPAKAKGGRAGVPHHPAKAKRVIQLYMAGGASHIDLFDHKPELEKRHGQKADFGEEVQAFQDGLGPWLKSPWKFSPHGQCGKMLSEVVAPLGKHVDQTAFIHNMVTRTAVHSQATLLQSTGFQLPGFPGLGCWVSYGLGTLNENLPAFVVLPDHRGLASNGAKNWEAAFLPGQHSGSVAYPGRPEPIAHLKRGPKGVFAEGAEQESLDLLGSLNRMHSAGRPLEDDLEARIHSYELAAKMQLAAPEAFDLSKETKDTLKLYGLDGPQGGKHPNEINDAEEGEAFAKKCLTARRLLERGVRFVQIWSGNDNGFPRRNWDSHEDLARDHGPLARGMAKATAALLSDLERTGLAEDTVVLWTTEFGRMPSSQGGKGRDHNPHCFTNWLWGAGVKGGTSYGESDPFGYKPLVRHHQTKNYDVHATLLHLLGIDHLRMTVRHNGHNRRVTDVFGHVVPEVLA